VELGRGGVTGARQGDIVGARGRGWHGRDAGLLELERSLGDAGLLELERRGWVGQDHWRKLTEIERYCVAGAGHNQRWYGQMVVSNRIGWLVVMHILRFF
jgi:hypothetical protein